MPTRAPHPCAEPGCAALVHHGSRCPAHRRAPIRDLEQVRRYDDRRGTAAERGYDARWRKVRELKLATNPLCEECERQGYVMPGELIDHIVAKRNGGTDDLSNLQTLCRPCHAKKTAEDVAVGARRHRRR